MPDDLKSLARRHALVLRYTRFNADAEGIELALRNLLPHRKPKWLLPALGGGVGVAGIAALVVWLNVAAAAPSATRQTKHNAGKTEHQCP